MTAFGVPLVFEACCWLGRAFGNAPGLIRLAPRNLDLQRLEETAGTKWTVNKRNNCILPVLEGTCCPSGTFLIAYALYTANLYLPSLFSTFVREMKLEQTFLEMMNLIGAVGKMWFTVKNEHWNLSHFFTVQYLNCIFCHFNLFIWLLFFFSSPEPFK